MTIRNFHGDYGYLDSCLNIYFMIAEEKLTGEDLLQLQREKGKICVSIIVPTHRLSPERRTDSTVVKRAIESAKQLMENNYTESQVKPLFPVLDEMYSAIDFNHNQEGLGIYVSPDLRMHVKFPFPVEEKVMVSSQFEIRDMLYKVNFASSYLVLMLSEKEGRLFEGSWGELAEVSDHEFPAEFKDEFLYNPPSQSSSYSGYSHVKSFEKDKSEMEETRHKQAFHTIDKWLENYLLKNTPLIIVGPEKVISWFEQVSVHRSSVIGKFPGNYSHSGMKEVAERTWPAVLDHNREKNRALLNEFIEKTGQNLTYTDLAGIWQAVKEGKAFKLLVEKDYRRPGFVDRDENQYHLYLHPPVKPHKVITDVIDYIIEMVLEKNGEVYFFENGELSEQGRIALITRY